MSDELRVLWSVMALNVEMLGLFFFPRSLIIAFLFLFCSTCIYYNEFGIHDRDGTPAVRRENI